MSYASDRHIDETRPVELTAAQARQILYALDPLLRQYDRRDPIPDSDLDNEQPVPELRGVLLGHLRAAWWVRVWLREQLEGRP